MSDPPAISAQHVDSFVCPGCGYSLFGIEHTARCPECGLEIDRSVLGESQLPWSHRRKIGRIRAFLKTAWMASVRPKRLLQEMNRPVSYEDARLFRHICILLGIIPALAGIIVFFKLSDWKISNLQWIGGMPVVAISVWIFMVAISGFPSLFLSPSDMPALRQNRAIALSYYASAPLILTWVSVLSVALEFAASGFKRDWYFRNGGPGSALGVFPWCLLIMIVVPVLFLIYSRQLSLIRRLIGAISIVVAWPILFAVIAVGIPAVVAFLVLAIKTLW